MCTWEIPQANTCPHLPVIAEEVHRCQWGSGQEDTSQSWSLMATPGWGQGQSCVEGTQMRPFMGWLLHLWVFLKSSEFKTKPLKEFKELIKAIPLPVRIFFHFFLSSGSMFKCADSSCKRNWWVRGQRCFWGKKREKKKNLRIKESMPSQLTLLRTSKFPRRPWFYLFLFCFQIRNFPQD